MTKFLKVATALTATDLPILLLRCRAPAADGLIIPASPGLTSVLRQARVVVGSVSGDFREGSVWAIAAMLSAQRWPTNATLSSTPAVLEPTIPIISEIASDTVELGLVASVVR
jgi:hypothetical protein